MRALSLLVVVRTAALDNTAVCRRRALLGCASGVNARLAGGRSARPVRFHAIDATWLESSTYTRLTGRFARRRGDRRGGRAVRVGAHAAALAVAGLGARAWTN